MLGYSNGGCPRGAEADVLDCDSIVSEFELLSFHYIRFWTNNLGKGMNLLISTNTGLNSIKAALLQGGIWN